MNASATIEDLALSRSLPTIWARRFVLSAGGILLLGGAAKILAVLEHSQMLNLTDPIFGISFYCVIAFVGIAEIAIAYLCLFTSKRNLSLMLMIWLTITFAAYRIGLWTMGWHHPYPLLGNLIETLNVSALIADGIVMVTSAYLLTGGIAMFWFERKRAQEAKFQKMSCPSCGGHIEFPVHALGKKISCPHCNTDITLKKPA